MTLIGILLAVATASAAPQKTAFQPKPLGQYVKNGVVIGGIANESFSILRIEKLAATDGAERMVIVYGNHFGEAVKTDPGYFHINVDERFSRVTIDLAQVQKTAVDAGDLARLFKNSKIVSATEMTMDPIDQSTNIFLNLKQPAEVKAKIEKVKGSQALIIDLRPDSKRN